MTAKAIFADDSEALAHYGVLGMKWGVRHDKQKSGERDVSRGIGLTPREQKLYNKSNEAYKKHRRVATEVARKIDNNDYQRSDLDKLKKAASKDIKATEKFAKSTGQMSKDGRAYIRSRNASRVANPAHHTLVLAGGVAAPMALMLGQPVAAMAIGSGTALTTLGTSALNMKLSEIKSSTARQYYNDIAKANKNRKPIEAYG